MEKFTVHTGTAAPLRRSNVDTDQIIPAVYLKRVTRTGFDGRAVQRLARGPGRSSSTTRRTPRRRSWSPGRSSASARRANTRCGRCRTRGSGPSSPRASGTSSAATRSRVGCCRSSSDCSRGRAVAASRRRDPTAEVTVDLVERQVRAPGAELGFPARRPQPLAADGGLGRHWTDASPRGRRSPPSRRRGRPFLPPVVPRRPRVRVGGRWSADRAGIRCDTTTFFGRRFCVRRAEGIPCAQNGCLSTACVTGGKT